MADRLSDDLILKIFVRMPIKSLLKLRCLSKSWCNIVDDPVFAHMQYEFGDVEQRTLLLGTLDASKLWAETTFYALRDNEEARVIRAADIPMTKFLSGSWAYGSCNGLMYFAQHSRDDIVVSNPLKSQFRILPPLPREIYYYSDFSNSTAIGLRHNHSDPPKSAAIGLGFDNLTKTFKMVYSNNYHTLVHTLGTTSWRKVSGITAYYCHSDEKSVFVHGFLHWMTKPLMINDCQGQILAFDVSRETFKAIRPPEINFKHSEMLFRILDIKGNLAMLDLSCRRTIDVWVMDYEKQVWGKEYTIDITIVGQIYNDSTKVLGHWKQDEILFSFASRDYCGGLVTYWSYSMKTGHLYKCDVQTHPKIYSLRGSLISIPGA